MRIAADNKHLLKIIFAPTDPTRTTAREKTTKKGTVKHTKAPRADRGQSCPPSSRFPRQDYSPLDRLGTNHCE
ncbi:hypothetical protein SK128_012053 [Halocaridina rubra]|uniref:Uncharacterized protein n=1 Tax=Halocaridina rubra TaxID=373956 RepID=A0AAN8WFU7_HALRR